MTDGTTTNGKVMIVPLGRAAPPAVCGGKAFHLGQMLRRGFPVPPGLVVLDPAFQDFLDANRLRATITACRRLDVRDPPALGRAARAIRAAIT